MVDELQYKLEKQDKINENLREQIEKLKHKLNNVPASSSQVNDESK